MLRLIALPTVSRNHGSRRHLTWSIVISTITITLTAACSSSSPKGTAANSTVTTTASSAENVRTARAYIGFLEHQTSRLPVTTPIDKPVPKGLKVMYINCGAPACSEATFVLQAATRDLGWTLEVINTNASPQEVQNAWAQVLREKPFGVIYAGLSETQFSGQLTAANDAGIKVVAIGSTDNAAVGRGIDWIGGVNAFGPVFANWTVANSPDGAPHVLYVSLPDFPIVVEWEEQLKTSFASLAPNGKLYILNTPASDIGTAAALDSIVSFLRSHPDVRYVVGGVDNVLIGLPAALKAAGIGGINTFGDGPTSANMQYISEGLQSGTTAYPVYEDFYGAVDALARLSVNEPLIAWQPPVEILTRKNLPNTSAVVPIVQDAPTQFEALWK